MQTRIPFCVRDRVTGNHCANDDLDACVYCLSISLLYKYCWSCGQHFDICVCAGNRYGQRLDNSGDKDA